MTSPLTLASRLLVGLVLALLAWEGVAAQYRIPRQPRAAVTTLRALEHGAGQAREALSLDQGTLTLAPPTAQELREASQAGRDLRTFIFAVERPLSQGTASLGTFAQDSEGGYVWRAVVRAPRAKSIGLRLGRYALPEGAALFIQPLGAPATGALTEAHNSPDSLLQIAPIAGEAVEMLYEFPEGTSASALRLPFVVESAFYGFRELSGARQSQSFAQEGEPFYDHPQASLEDNACAPNVLAHPEAWKEARSTVLLIVGGTSASTGALINNTRQDGTPYVLTSAHCLNNLFRQLGNLPVIRRNAATTVFFFGFQSPLQQGNIRATEEQSLSGASLTAYSEASEMCLLRIEGLPTDASGRRAIPTAYQPYFAGWNISPSPAGPYVGIHHPGGSTKRYNRTRQTTITTQDYGVYYYDAAGQRRRVDWQDKHWEVEQWTIGMTAQGSSGSPLFDKDGLIIGALTGGASSCASPYEDRYWALRKAWTPESPGLGSLTYLRPWLDPTGTGATTCPALDPQASRTIQRLSPIYPDPAILPVEAFRPNRLSSPAPTVDAVGNRLSLPALSGVRVLGAYVIFKADGRLRAEDIPQLRLRLQRFAQRDDAGSTLLDFASTTLGQFSRFSPTGTTELAGRTLRTDTLELFFPAPEGTTLSLDEGQYLLSCQTTDGRALPLSFVGYAGSARRAQGWSGWSHRPTAGWERSTDLAGGAYWIDLLVDSPAPIVLPQDSGLLLPEGIHAYYYGGAIHLAGDALFSTAFTLRIYDLTGQLHLEHSFARSAGGHEALTLSLPQGQYLATIVPAGIKKPQRSERLNLPFVHR